LNDPEYRKAFVASQINVSVPFQIRALMKAHGWTQERLAEKTGMRQPSISGLMTPGKTRPNIETLRRLAEAFDCALAVRFVPFSELAEWSEKFDPETFNVPDFEHDSKSQGAAATGAVGMGALWGNWPYHVANWWRESSNRIGATFEYPLIAYHDAEAPIYRGVAIGSGNLVEGYFQRPARTNVTAIDAKPRPGQIPRKSVSRDQFFFGFMANQTHQHGLIRTGT
jgi:transcriptional regulator with XRE-family HTH domain